MNAYFIIDHANNALFCGRDPHTSLPIWKILTDDRATFNLYCVSDLTTAQSTLQKIRAENTNRPADFELRNFKF